MQEDISRKCVCVCVCVCVCTCTSLVYCIVSECTVTCVQFVQQPPSPASLLPFKLRTTGQSRVSSSELKSKLKAQPHMANVFRFLAMCTLALLAASPPPPVASSGPCTEWLNMCGASNASAPDCCSGSICDVQTQCPSGARPPPGSRCGPTVDPSQCHFCQPPAPPPHPTGCGKAGAACSTSTPCCENEGRCPSFLGCMNKVCRFMPPPSQPPTL